MLLDFHSELYSWARGGLFVLFLYHLLIFFQNKNKLYLFYSLYLLALTIYFLEDVLEPTYLPIYDYIHYFIQFVALAIYLKLAQILLDTRNKFVKWHAYFNFGVQILFAIAAIFVFMQTFLGVAFQIMAFSIVMPIAILFITFSFLAISKKVNDVASKIFIYGSIIYVVLVSISFLKVFVEASYYSNAGLKAKFFVYLAAFTQAIIFSVIIGIINKKIEQKSINAEIKLALKLKEMEELKMTALQSQMNPHFLFNSLNSINNFVIKNEVEKASDYITKFSKLIRAILNSSSTPTSYLSEELSLLDLYVKLEQMRVSGGFEYIVELDETLKLDKIKVPPMFLQPFVENAIWHGIMKKEGPKEIKLTIQKKENYVECMVLDNGIGINASKEATYMISKKKFYGTEATENRIKILYQNKDVHVNIKDISSGKTTGTCVTIQFPLN